MMSVGTPREMVEGMRDEPWWAVMEEIAPTLAYDSEIMGERNRGGTMPLDLVGGVTRPTLVLSSGASPAWRIDITRRIAGAMPNGRDRVLEGQGHVVPAGLLAPVLAEFFANRNGARHRTESRKEPA